MYGTSSKSRVTIRHDAPKGFKAVLAASYKPSMVLLVTHSIISQQCCDLSE